MSEISENNRSKTGFVYVDHVADVGFLSRAPSLEELFCVSAEAMFGVVADISSVGSSESFDVVVESPDINSLLVDWLSELLFIFDADEVLLSKFVVHKVSEKENGEFILKATVLGDPIDNTVQKFKTEVKAVTYNNLKIENNGSFWEAEVVLDL